MRNALHHPHTGALIEPVGYRRNGAPIWPILGGSDDAGTDQSQQQTTDTGGQQTSSTDTGQQQASQTDQASQQAGAWDGKVESLPEPVQKMIRDLRKEAGDRRTSLTAAEQKQQDMVRAFAKAAGIELPGDDTKPDPEALTQQLTKTQQQARQAAVELAVYRGAGKHTADPDALLDSRAFLAKVADLDPTAADFAAQVDTAIKKAVEDNPKLKAGRVPGASGADHAGGTGGQRTPHPRSIQEAVAAHYGTA